MQFSSKQIYSVTASYIYFYGKSANFSKWAWCLEQEEKVAKQESDEEEQVPQNSAAKWCNNLRE